MSKFVSVINYLFVLMLIFTCIGYTVCSLYALYLHNIPFNPYGYFSLGVTTLVLTSTLAQKTMPPKIKR